jgi:hypothetical protein
MRKAIAPEAEVAATALPLAKLMPAALPWFLRALRQHPVPTIAAVVGALLILRSTIGISSIPLKD